MASLKEVKGRITSVNGTLKITSAMKMVASAKLRKAQDAIEGMLPYETKLSHILSSFLQSGENINTPLTEVRNIRKVALVVFSSNSSLCGGYNANIIKHFNEWVMSHKELEKENIIVFPIGKKIAEAVSKDGYISMGDFSKLADNPNYDEASALADRLMNMYINKDVDKIIFIYNHFKSKSSQELTVKQILPISTLENNDNTRDESEKEKLENTNYIFEPSSDILLDLLFPKVIRIKTYTALLDANASEHAARTMAMQIATDNGNDILQELTLMYNKGRQQVITNELLDIIGGNMA